MNHGQKKVQKNKKIRNLNEKNFDFNFVLNT